MPLLPESTDAKEREAPGAHVPSAAPPPAPQPTEHSRPNPISSCLVGHMADLSGHHAASSCPASPVHSPPPPCPLPPPYSLPLPLLIPSLSLCPWLPRILILLQLQQVPDPWMWHEKLLGILVPVTGARERTVSGMQTANLLGNYSTNGLCLCPSPMPLSLSLGPVGAPTAGGNGALAATTLSHILCWGTLN